MLYTRFVEVNSKGRIINFNLLLLKMLRRFFVPFERIQNVFKLYFRAAFWPGLDIFEEWLTKARAPIYIENSLNITYKKYKYIYVKWICSHFHSYFLSFSSLTKWQLYKREEPRNIVFVVIISWGRDSKFAQFPKV